MSLIYLVRHGQTDWNAATRLQGQMDIPINDTGRGQAVRNGGILKNMIADPGQFDFVASPLGRTRETMEIIREQIGRPREGYRTNPLLMEIHFGEWQGSSWEELRLERDAEISVRFDDPWNTVAPGAEGESYAMLSDRAAKWLASVKTDTVVVTHGGITRCVRGLIERIPTTEIPHLDIPQDKVLVIENGTTRWV